MKILANQFSTWLFQYALPLWSSAVIDRVLGGFYEVVELDGLASHAPRRARVQGRQSFTFAYAGLMGWSGEWLAAAEHGIAYLNRYYRKANGLYRTMSFPDGSTFNSDVMTYDQAFSLLAMASLYSVSGDRRDVRRSARALIHCLCQERRCANGGFWEFGSKNYLSNPQMHLLEATMAWASVDQNPIWADIANEIADLAVNRFIDPNCGALFEEFDSNWAPITSEHGSHVVEPGHQYEWAWLLKRWSLQSGRSDLHATAETLFKAGRRGLDVGRNVALDEIDQQFKPRRATARLWPQTERLKAASLFFQCAKKDALPAYESEVILAAESLWRYFNVPTKGLWRDKMQVDGSFIDEPAPASSFYHIILAIDALASAAGTSRSQFGERTDPLRQAH